MRGQIPPPILFLRKKYFLATELKGGGIKNMVLKWRKGVCVCVCVCVFVKDWFKPIFPLTKT